MGENSDHNRDEKQDLAAVESRIDDARRREAENRLDGPAKKNAQMSGIGLAFRVSIELISAVAVGGGFGWLLDSWLETRPWLMLVFILIGGAAGMLNVYRLSSGYGYAAGYDNKEPDAGDGNGGDRGKKQRG